VSVTETIKRVLKDYHERISTLEDEKFDLEYAVKKKDFEVEFGFTTVVRLRMIRCVSAILFLCHDTFVGCDSKFMCLLWSVLCRAEQACLIRQSVELMVLYAHRLAEIFHLTVTQIALQQIKCLLLRTWW